MGDLSKKPTIVCKYESFIGFKSAQAINISACTLLICEIMNYMLFFLFVFGLYALSINSRAEDSRTSYIAPALEDECWRSVEKCHDAIGDRVVKVIAGNGYGSGFIAHSDENLAVIITSSHVVRTGNGRKSNILDISVYDSNWVGGAATSACAFFKISYGDVALILMPNFWGKRFPPLRDDFRSTAGDEAYVVDFKHEYKRHWTYTVDGFNNRTMQVYLYEKAEPGMSGSPIISKGGELLGVLQGEISNQYFGYRRTTGSLRTENKTINDFKVLLTTQNQKSNYVCRNF